VEDQGFGGVVAVLGRRAVIASTGIGDQDSTYAFGYGATQGELCGLTEDCANGRCVNSYCCDQPCSGACEACSRASGSPYADGFCGPVAEGHPGLRACKLACDGSGDCATSMCSGSSIRYDTGEITDCTPYMCEESRCLVQCDSNTDCTNARCRGGECVPFGTSSMDGCLCRMAARSNERAPSRWLFGLVALAALRRRTRRARPSPGIRCETSGSMS
jgi:hypothetical protein